MPASPSQPGHPGLPGPPHPRYALPFPFPHTSRARPPAPASVGSTRPRHHGVHERRGARAVEQSRTQQESARRIGPFRLITRLDPPHSVLPCRRFVARTEDGGHTVLLNTPLPGTDPARFAAEAEAARFLLGPWIAPVTGVAAPGEAPWSSSPYLPALPLPVALAVHGGPLPESTVRAVGATLAEALATAHGQRPHARRGLPRRRAAHRRRPPADLFRRGTGRLGRRRAAHRSAGPRPGGTRPRAGLGRPAASAGRRLRARRRPRVRRHRSHGARAGRTPARPAPGDRLVPGPRPGRPAHGHRPHDGARPADHARDGAELGRHPALPRLAAGPGGRRAGPPVLRAPRRRTPR